jgi:LPXTG-site transpeptidase (sortase) family protein
MASLTLPTSSGAWSAPASGSSKWLPRINNLLLVVVIFTNLYVIAVPFLPQLLFAIDKQTGKQQQLEAAIKPSNSPSGSSGATTPPAEQGNRLIIPSMVLDQPVVEGTNMYRALDQGVWRWPGGSTPDKGGNTVMLAHRFTYTLPKGVFYFLDKVKVGDDIGVTWNNKKYLYTVKQTKVVNPTQTEILNATTTPTLTLYTCTPLWLPKNRLVVVAELSSGSTTTNATDKASTSNTPSAAEVAKGINN